MANRFVNPFPEFGSSTAKYNGGILRFYASGTSTPLSYYTDSALSTGAATTHTLNSAGRPTTAIFLQNLAYKITLEDSSGSIIWTADPVYASDYSTYGQFQVYAGNPNGNVAGTAGSGTIPSSVIWDSTNNILYVCTTSGVAAAAVWTAVNASATTPAVPFPQGRLTLTSATPVLAADVTAATAVYYTPFNGVLVPIYNGTSMVPTEFAELTLTLASQHAASTIYDVFVFSNSGTLTLATGPAWTNSGAGTGARGSGAGTTQLARVKGLWTNAVSMTGRNGATTYTIAANRGTYLGSIFMDGSNGQITCHASWGQSRKFGVWNAYNRVLIVLRAGDSTASWAYGSATIRPSNNAAANSITVFQGLAEEFYDLAFMQTLTTGATPTGNIGIGYNATAAFTGFKWTTAVAASANMSGRVNHQAVPAIGIQTVTALEQTNGTTAATFQGGEEDMVLTAIWRG